jgi:hypothetical protein
MNVNLRPIATLTTVLGLLIAPLLTASIYWNGCFVANRQASIHCC